MFEIVSRDTRRVISFYPKLQNKVFRLSFIDYGNLLTYKQYR